ncbi:MAG TPA: helix-turn-helix domain-containing protein [Solirubrobacteraceae bacterium]|jgi:transposase|nr:helix-turn-helix domain-containing protein [Solirubrobacteraceae bacterium]
MDRTALKQMLDEGLSLAEIGRRVGRHESTVAYWVEQHVFEANNSARHVARGGLERAQLEALIERGLSISEIASAVDRSKGTVRHWLREYGLKMTRSASQQVGATRPRRLERPCPHHGETMFQLRREGGYRCLKCRSDAVAKRRRRIKQILVHEAGGACRICGYDRCIAALEFHHVAPADKRFSLSERGVARSLARARQEAAKCILLCSNCHVEVEAGLHPNL